MLTRLISGVDDNSVVILNTSPGTITSPDLDGDGLYDYNVDVLWILEASEGYIIQYTIQSALIAASYECYQDGLRVGI